MNTDITTYEFDDPDLEVVVNNLSPSDRNIIIWHLMGLTQAETGVLMGVSGSWICQKLNVIRRKIKKYMGGA